MSTDDKPIIEIRLKIRKSNWLDQNAIVKKLQDKLSWILATGGCKLLEIDLVPPDPLAAFDYCIICEEKLTPVACDMARKELTRFVCINKACIRKNEIRLGHLCCDQAENIPCVCARSFKCPVHHPNGIHFGTHD